MSEDRPAYTVDTGRGVIPSAGEIAKAVRIKVADFETACKEWDAASLVFPPASLSTGYADATVRLSERISELSVENAELRKRVEVLEDLLTDANDEGLQLQSENNRLRESLSDTSPSDESLDAIEVLRRRIAELEHKGKHAEVAVSEAELEARYMQNRMDDDLISEMGLSL